MKIALLDAEPRICGPMSWMNHLKNGFAALGHDADIVSATKSGKTRTAWGNSKWGARWSVFAPDVVVRNADLVDVLDKYDLVVLPEPKVPSEDKAAAKLGEHPTYVDALLRTKTPFTTALHGNDYYEKDAIFARELLASPNFTGTLFSHSPRSTERNDLLDLTKQLVPLPLPYVPKLDVDSVYPTSETIGATGRFMFNKGHGLLALAGLYMSHELIELWGAASAGLGANVSFTAYEGLLEFAENFKRYGDQEAKKAAGDPNADEHGNTLRPYLWDIRLTSGTLVRYLGNYTDPISTCQRLGIHVNLTGYRFSGGLVEFSTLEAMDAGSMCMTTGQVSSDAYVTRRVDLVDPPGTMKRTLADRAPAIMVAEAIRAFQADLELSPSWRRDVVRHNRNQLRVTQDPVTIAATILEAGL